MEVLIILLMAIAILGMGFGIVEYVFDDSYDIFKNTGINTFGKIVLSPIFIPLFISYAVGSTLCIFFEAMFIKR